jgi:hypothetical protein
MRSVRPTLRSFFVVLAVVTAGASAPAVGAQTTSTTAQRTGLVIRLLEVPTASRNDPRANQYIVDHVAPGSTVERKFEVRNDTDAPLRPKLYVGGAAIKNDEFVPDDGTASDVASWSTAQPPSADLAPGAAVTATVTIRVPSGVPAGERYGAVWAEAPGAETPAGVTVVNRVGIRIYLSVGGGAAPPTRFSLPSFTATRDADGRPGVDIRACNDGGRAVDTAGDLELTDGPGGTSAGPFPSATGTTIAPGDCAVIPVRLDPNIPRGPWRATARIRSGTAVEEATATITFPDAPATASAPVSAKAKDVTGPAKGKLALVLALLLLLLVLGLLLFLLWRRRRDRDAAEAPAPVA